MKYLNVVKARFIERPNRFIAYCEIKDKTVISHVRNTGRLKELLIPGATVYLENIPSTKRKTEYSLIAVQKGSIVVNIDSTAPNKVFTEALKSDIFTLPGLEDVIHIKPERTFGKSRFDFYLESHEKSAFIEVKGVTLEKEGVALFPDAPTERGVKHIEELINAKNQGYEAYIVFIVQMTGVSSFSPNTIMHPAFGEALKTAKRQGVKILCYDCTVTYDSLALNSKVPVVL